MAGPDGTFDRGGQAGVGPIAGQEQIAANWSRRPAGGRPARRWRRRSRGARARSARAAASAAARSTLATSLQIFCASASRGVSSSRSAALIVTESRPGKAKIHSVVAVEHADDRRLVGGRLDAEMRVDDGAELGRRLQAGHERGCGIRRHREDHDVLGDERDGIVAEIERIDLAAGMAQRMQLMAEAHRRRRAPRGRRAPARSHRAQAVARDQRPAGAVRPPRCVSRITAPASRPSPPPGRC